ncbi:Quinol monooxygenase YgiN [Roseateles sp. YR242]|uniref:putative quinol monooxygenase n=1 Tax=Roseateles sp. YR242 TaxID=1855305 RepID=UPI0008B1F42C|nr:putative quinol monooxygenase [Roseateles sp. YR242]SEK97479.1 Quinol monooxygenase YgiN [Roseateles sp. YR242]
MSTRDDIIVVARWETTPEHLPAVLQAAGEMRRQSLAEPGCLSYEVFQSPDSATSLLLLERYRDDQALEAHRNASHYTALVVRQIVPLLTSRQVELLQGRNTA